MGKQSNKLIWSTDNQELKELKRFFNFINRNKKTIIRITSVFFLLSIIYGFQKKKTWQGQFEIVLDINNSNSNPLINQLSGINFIGFDNGVSSLDTEVGILKSPSVLMPIFDFVRSTKKQTNPKIDLNFANWRKNLSVKLRDNTSILDIKYNDKDKNIIIPVLEKVTFAYQKYSGKNKKRKFSLAENYLKDQINIYKIKSANSLRELQRYAIEQDLITLTDQDNLLRNITFKNINRNLSESQDPTLLRSERSLVSLTIEEIRVNASNRIRNIDTQIKQIEDLGNNSQQVQYFVSTIEALQDSGLPKKLSEIEEKLAELRGKYKQKDEAIMMGIKKRNSLIDLLKKRSIGYLKAERSIQEAIMEAASRPKGVLLKYKELGRLANRDELTLIELENNLRLVNLDKAKLEDPWELISKPTLKKSYISPKKARISLVGIILGLFSSTLFSLWKEKKSGLIYEEDYLEDILELPILEKINITNGIFQKNNKEIFLNEILEIKPKTIFRFIRIGSINLEEFKNYLNIFSKNELSFSIQESLNNRKENETFVIIMRIGKINYSEIISLKERLERKNLKPLGILLFTEK